MLRPGRPSGAGSERAAGGLGTGTCGRAAALGLRAQLRSAGSSRGGTEVGLEARRAGTRFPPRGLGGGRDGAGGGGGGGGAEGTEPQPLSRPPPPRARARAHPSRPTAAARARAHLRPPRKPGRLALRPHPIGSAHLRPRRQPIGTRLAQSVGGPPSRKSRPPPRDWSRPAREGRDHLKRWASPDLAGEQEGACAGFGVSAPVSFSLKKTCLLLESASGKFQNGAGCARQPSGSERFCLCSEVKVFPTQLKSVKQA
nr:laforin-like [Equus asinus]